MSYLYSMRILVSLFGVSYSHPAPVLLQFVIRFFFCSNAPHNSTPLLNLRTLIFGLTPFVWMQSIKLTNYLRREYHFWFTPFWFTPTVSGWQLGRRTAWVYHKSSWHQRIIMCVMNISHRKGTKKTAERHKATIEWNFRAATEGYRTEGIDVSLLDKFTVSELTGNC
jgi:hypothetical protein